jgi:hypothetical protein
MDLPSGDQAGCSRLPVRWLCHARGFGPEEDLLLRRLGLVAGAGGEEGEGVAIRGPGGRGVGAVSGAFYGDDL